MKLDNYIENVYRELLPHQNIEYEDLYQIFSHHRLSEIFSTLHYLLVDNLVTRRSFDIDDFILNIVGAFIGFGIWKSKVIQKILRVY